jgi:hypothetical protein
MNSLFSVLSFFGGKLQKEGQTTSTMEPRANIAL